MEFVMNDHPYPDKLCHGSFHGSEGELIYNEKKYEYKNQKANKVRNPNGEKR